VRIATGANSMELVMERKRTQAQKRAKPDRRDRDREPN
jgi:hypothetical protein